MQRETMRISVLQLEGNTDSRTDVGVPTIAFFCGSNPEPTSEEKTEDGFLGMIYSLIHQLICLWPPVLDDKLENFDITRFASLDASPASWYVPHPLISEQKRHPESRSPLIE